MIESATEEEKQTAKDWQQVEEIIRGNPYREAVKQEMYKMSRDEKERYLYLREEMADTQLFTLFQEFVVM